MTDTRICVGDPAVEIRYDGSRRIGTREITPSGARAALTQGALRYSPTWLAIASAFCAERDAATEFPAAGPHRVGGDVPGSSLIPPECGDPGAPPHLLAKAGHRKARRGDARSGMAGSTAT